MIGEGERETNYEGDGIAARTKEEVVLGLRCIRRMCVNYKKARAAR